MALNVLLEKEKIFFMAVVLLTYLACQGICETGDCRQQEFRDRSGNCVLCKQCGPGMELSKECGFGYGEDAQCVTCRPHRFKEDWGFQKCKPCLDCALVSRFQKTNCSATNDAICGDCLPGFYRKTKLVGFQDMECVPCGDPPPPYEPHCTSKVNLVKISATDSSPRDTALAAVICSALTAVLLALLILCVIYCKRQFMEKKPTWSLRAQDMQYNGSELSCFDSPQISRSTYGVCCQCHQDSSRACGPAHLIPSLCCDEVCSIEQLTLGCGAHSKLTLQDRSAGHLGDMMPVFLESLSRSICGEFSDAWPLMQNPICGDTISFCDSYPEIAREDNNSLNPENESTASMDLLSNHQDLTAGAIPMQAYSGTLQETAGLSSHCNSQREPTRSWDTLITRSQLEQERGDIINISTQTSI